MVEQLLEKLAPSQFFQPQRAALVIGLFGQIHQMADGKGAEAQMGGKLRGAAFGREVAVERIIGQNIQKIAERGLGGRFAAVLYQGLRGKAEFG